MKKHVITMMAALALGLAASGQEVMKLELNNGQVVTYPVENINRFYFEGAKQQEELAKNCEVGIADEVILTNGIAYELDLGSDVKEVLFGWSDEGLEEYSDQQIINRMKTVGKIASDKYIFFDNLQEDKDNYIFYTGLNASGQRGPLYRRYVKTKKVSEEVEVDIEEPMWYDNQYFYVNLNIKGGDVYDYYAIADVENDIEPIESLSVLALLWKQSILQGTETAYYVSKPFSQPRPNGENSIRIFTWARDVNKEFSGIITGKIFSINSNVKAQKAHWNQPSNEPKLGSISEEEMARLMKRFKIVNGGNNQK